MTTPNTYDFKNFKSIVSNAPNIFHQTGISNLRSILALGTIYSPGTLWGFMPTVANAFYLSNPTRLNNLKLRAQRGFVDYVFCSFLNGIRMGQPRYGSVSIEINKQILLGRECFVYLFNFVTGWNRARQEDKYSDLTTWNYTVSNFSSLSYNEILVRRKIELDKYYVKFHCFDNVQRRVLETIKEYGYDEDDLVIHDSPNYQLREYDMDMIAEINGEKFKAIFSTEDGFVSVFNVISDDDGDFIGRYSVDSDMNIIEEYPMSGTSHIIGKLSAVNNSGSSSATA